MKYVAVVLSILIVCSCNNKTKKEIINRYDIKIDYLNTPEWDDRDMYNDTLMIVFYGNFQEDTMDIFINQNFYKTKLLTTDARTGESGEIKTIKYKDIKSIGLRINNGNLIFVEPPKRQYNIQLIYLDNTVSVKFHRRLPAFD